MLTVVVVGSIGTDDPTEGGLSGFGHTRAAEHGRNIRHSDIAQPGGGHVRVRVQRDPHPALSKRLARRFRPRVVVVVSDPGTFCAKQDTGELWLFTARLQLAREIEPHGQRRRRRRRRARRHVQTAPASLFELGDVSVQAVSRADGSHQEDARYVPPRPRLEIPGSGSDQHVFRWGR